MFSDKVMVDSDAVFEVDVSNQTVNIKENGSSAEDINCQLVYCVQ